jgi:glycosyltransferase involved in cell wall biosynthesis
VPDKRQRQAIDVIANANFDVDLLILGEGTLKTNLQSLATELNVADQVHITGHVPEIYPYYAVSDVFVSPSRGEGLPITLLEAMASELPVVATDIPGIREVVKDGQTGYLVGPDDTERMCSHIKKLRDVKLRESYGANGYQRAQDMFSVEGMAKSYANLYSEIANN